MKKTALLAIATVCAVSGSAFAQADAKATHEHKVAAAPTAAVAVLQATAKGPQVKGTISFTKAPDGIKVEGEITGLTPGKHGFHVHEFGDVTSQDGTSAGGHFNPSSAPHGAPDSDKRHAGDFGNVEADQTGTAKISFVDKQISFEGPTSILGRGLVVHAKADDLKTQPSGDAGDRVAVGVIGVRKGEAAAK
jgi:Cu-Zn family superoxide dismutase